MLADHPLTYDDFAAATQVDMTDTREEIVTAPIPIRSRLVGTTTIKTKATIVVISIVIQSVYPI